ncbi:putative PEP-binding protein [Methylobacterium oryzae CBMB20]
MVAQRMPSAAEQEELYRKVFAASAGKSVTVRTLDIGGDKILPYMAKLEEENPALGWRAIRIGLDRPALLRMQLRRPPEGRRRRPAQDHVPDGRDGGRVRPRARHRRARRRRT